MNQISFTTKMHLERVAIKSSELIKTEAADDLVIEEPLEIRLEFGHSPDRLSKRSIAVTMRTPGNDRELAIGFLVTEGILNDHSEVAEVVGCGPELGPHSGQNIVRVKLQPAVSPDLSKLERNFYATSSCGICGKASLEAVKAAGLKPIPRSDFSVSGALIRRVPELLNNGQHTFRLTGANHGAALITPDGGVAACCEDVGRHNAVDKVIGAEVLRGRGWRCAMANRMMAVSGRAGFELVQKSLVVGIPVMVAIGAPSSLAVELAQKFDMTLVGFVRENRYNIYSGRWRIHD